MLIGLNRHVDFREAYASRHKLVVFCVAATLAAVPIVWAISYARHLPEPPIGQDWRSAASVTKTPPARCELRLSGSAKSSEYRVIFDCRPAIILQTGTVMVNRQSYTQTADPRHHIVFNFTSPPISMLILHDAPSTAITINYWNAHVVDTQNSPFSRKITNFYRLDARHEYKTDLIIDWAKLAAFRDYAHTMIDHQNMWLAWSTVAGVVITSFLLVCAAPFLPIFGESDIKRTKWYTTVLSELIIPFLLFFPLLLSPSIVFTTSTALTSVAPEYVWPALDRSSVLGDGVWFFAFFGFFLSFLIAGALFAIAEKCLRTTFARRVRRAIKPVSFGVYMVHLDSGNKFSYRRDLSLALESYKKALFIAHQSVGVKPESIFWQCNLFVSCLMVAHVFAEQGNGDKAREFGEAAFLIASELVKTSPKNATFQTALRHATSATRRDRTR